MQSYVKVGNVSDVDYVRQILFDNEVFGRLDDNMIRVAWDPNITYYGYDTKAYAVIGDAILDMAVLHLMIELGQVKTAHDMTEIKSRLVKNASLTCMMDSKNLCEITTNRYDKSCADAFEAFIGVIYVYLLSINYNDAIKFILVWLVEKWNLHQLLHYLTNHPNAEICHLRL